MANELTKETTLNKTMDGGFDQKTPISWDSILLIGVGMDKCRKYNPGKGKRKMTTYLCHNVSTNLLVWIFHGVLYDGYLFFQMNIGSPTTRYYTFIHGSKRCILCILNSEFPIFEFRLCMCSYLNPHTLLSNVKEISCG